jgi:predicted negative regulator of RcsB-dependent stress response
MKTFRKACALVLLFGAAAPAWAQDEITYYDRATKKDAKISGAIQSESPSQIVVKPAVGAAKTIPVPDLGDIFYNVPQLIRQEYRGAFNAEGRAEKALKEADRRKELASALQRYQELLPKVTEERPKTHVEFKIAKLLAWQAEDDPAGLDAAIDKLKQFKKEHPNSWEISRAADLLAQLLVRKKDYEGAQKAYEDLAATPNLSPETRQQCELKVAQVLVKAKKYDVAEKRLQELAKTVPADSPPGIRLQLSLAEAEAASGKAEPAAKRLEAIIDKVSDVDLKASAYNTLGDCHRLANRPKDALWDYLWVDVMYYQNKEEHAKALYYLTKLFKELKDEKRAQQYRAKLESKDFAGQEYQKQIINEK